jgi:hypothetical protein
MPDIVLIREEDKLALTKLDRPLEVLGRSKSPVVYVNADRKWRSGPEPIQNLHCAIGGAVVTYHDFVGRVRLACDAV